jgi:hypothetical protein
MMNCFYGTFFILFNILILVDRQTVSLPIDIEIVTPTYFGTDSLISLQFLQAAYITGLRLLPSAYPQLSVTHRFLTDFNATNCQTQQGNVQDLLARWYYLESRKRSTKIIVTPGQHETKLPLAEDYFSDPF